MANKHENPAATTPNVSVIPDNEEKGEGEESLPAAPEDPKLLRVAVRRGSVGSGTSSKTGTSLASTLIRASKKRRLEEEDVTDVNMDDELYATIEWMRVYQRDMTEYLEEKRTQKKSLSKEICQHITSNFDLITSEFNRLALEIACLRGMLNVKTRKWVAEDPGRCLQIVPGYDPIGPAKPAATRKTAVSSPPGQKSKETPAVPPSLSGRGLAKKPPKKTYSLVVKGTADETASDLAKKVKSSVNPTKDRIRVTGLRETKKNNVIVFAASEVDIVKAKGKLMEAGLTTEDRAKQKPRIILYNVPAGMSEGDLRDALASNNSKTIEGVSRNELDEELKLVFKIGPKGKAEEHWVLEVSPRIRNLLRSARRIFLGWTVTNVKDFVRISRCFKCQGLGHIAKVCQKDSNTCKYCGMDGHTHAQCPNKDTRSCAVCKRAGRAANHAVTSVKCPAYISALESLKANTDYIM